MALKNIDGLSFPRVLPNSKSARHLFTIWLDPNKRDSILWKLQENGVGVAVNFRSIHLMKYYKDTFGFEEGMFPAAERIGKSTISLPLYPKLTDHEVDFVIAKIKEALNF